MEGKVLLSFISFLLPLSSSNIYLDFLIPPSLTLSTTLSRSHQRAPLCLLHWQRSSRMLLGRSVTCGTGCGWCQTGDQGRFILLCILTLKPGSLFSVSILEWHKGSYKITTWQLKESSVNKKLWMSSRGSTRSLSRTKERFNIITNTILVTL